MNLWEGVNPALLLAINMKMQGLTDCFIGTFTKGKQREEQELLNKLVEDHDPAFDYDDIAHSNMTGEPCRDF